MGSLSPPPTPTTSPLTKIIPSTKEDKQEVLIHSKLYDVTNWIPKHPGGNIIRFYTNTSEEDATSAFEQFHHRCMPKARKFLNALPKRDVSPEHTLSQRHTLFTQELAQLHTTFEAEGLFKPSYIHVGLRFLECFFLFVFGIYLTVSSNSTPLLVWIGRFITALGVGRCGWFGHEAGHRSLTGNIKFDKFMHHLSYGFSIGLSPSWWSSQHNRHHAMPNRLEYDVDLSTLPLLAFNKKVIQKQANKTSGATLLWNNLFIRSQAILFVPVDVFLVVVYWKFYLHPCYAWKKRAYMDLFFMGLNHAMWITCLGARNHFIIQFLTAIYLLGNFTLNHTHLPVTEEGKSWIEYGLSHTVDIKSSPFVDWWMGYLNFQIEHHLFPQMPQYKNHLISERVAALAEKYGLPYQCIGYWEAVNKVFKNLEDVGNFVSGGGKNED